MAQIECADCHTVQQIIDRDSAPFPDMWDLHYGPGWICDSCRKRRNDQIKADQEAKRREEYLANLPKHLKSAGIEEHYTFLPGSQPPVRFAAEWIWLNKSENLLISGETGAGKTTSACFVASQLIQRERHVRYRTFWDLLTLWRAAKTDSNDRFATRKMFGEIKSYEVYIIDEIIGKTKMTDSAQELLFTLIEAVNSGSCKTKIWLLGNFYRGSIEANFSDPAPLLRRLQENFICAVIDKHEQKVKQISVYPGDKK